MSVRQHPRPRPFRGERLRALVRQALARLPAAAADVRVLVVGDDEMARWNREFLGRGGTTNVIAFPEEAPGEAPADTIAGDILVSAPTCLAQTREWPGTPEERVFYFILHGMLHLAGYDHGKGTAEARRMRRREAELYGAVVGPGRT
ncbi:MAG: rRNA maturation RNase YbeY [Gemmatimonadota bacterium]